MSDRTAVDVGYAKQKQYQSNRRRLHAVTKDARGLWSLLCSGKAATREYKGWASNLTCRKCQAALGIEPEEDE